MGTVAKHCTFKLQLQGKDFNVKAETCFCCSEISFVLSCFSFPSKESHIHSVKSCTLSQQLSGEPSESVLDSSENSTRDSVMTELMKNAERKKVFERNRQSRRAKFKLQEAFTVPTSVFNIKKVCEHCIFINMKFNNNSENTFPYAFLYFSISH